VYKTVILQNQRKSTGLSPCRARGRIQGCHPSEPEEEYLTITFAEKVGEDETVNL
jgi:hypothetical protein